jgi:ATP-dependent Clp protease ATP-binding subunit ClpC
MFERFHDASRRLIVVAQDEARSLGHGYIGTEHLLLACLHDDDWVSTRALAINVGDLGPLRKALRAVLRKGDDVPSGSIPFTADAKHALETAITEAQQMGHTAIGTGHILIGILDDEGAAWAPVLAALGVEKEPVRAGVARIHPSSPEASGPANDAAGGTISPAMVDQLLHTISVLGVRVDELQRRLEMLERRG